MQVVAIGNVELLHSPEHRVEEQEGCDEAPQYNGVVKTCQRGDGGVVQNGPESIEHLNIDKEKIAERVEKRVKDIRYKTKQCKRKYCGREVNVKDENNEPESESLQRKRR